MPIIQFDVAQEAWTSEQEKSLIAIIDVMREQLEYLIDHIAEQGICGCSQCQRYLRTRSVLLEIFDDPGHKVVPAIAKVA